MPRLKRTAITRRSNLLKNREKHTQKKCEDSCTLNEPFLAIIDGKRTSITVSEARQLMERMGFVILRVSDDGLELKNEWKIHLNEYETNSAYIIFNNPVDKSSEFKSDSVVQVGDGKRLSFDLNELSKSELRLKVDELARVLFPKLKPFGPSVLISEAGCKPQAKHSDWAFKGFSLIEQLNLDNFPISSVFAIQDKTSIDLWPGSHRIFHQYIKMKYLNHSQLNIDEWVKEQSMINRQTFNVPKGFVVFFRQDLVHAGSGYNRRNIRLFSYYNSGNMQTHNGYINFIHLYNEINHLFVD